MSEPPADYRSMSIDAILDNLAIHLYEPPLSKLREDLRSVPEVIRIPVLIIDFDTEVCMNSILGFLENSTGFYLIDTIAAMEVIGAHGTAATLRTIQRIMAEHGVTHERLRGRLRPLPNPTARSCRRWPIWSARRPRSCTSMTACTTARAKMYSSYCLHISSNAGTSLWLCWRLTLQTARRTEDKPSRSLVRQR
jgi:hypothetical protein